MAPVRVMNTTRMPKNVSFMVSQCHLDFFFSILINSETSRNWTARKRLQMMTGCSSCRSLPALKSVEKGGRREKRPGHRRERTETRSGGKNLSSQWEVPEAHAQQHVFGEQKATGVCATKGWFSLSPNKRKHKAFSVSFKALRACW